MASNKKGDESDGSQLSEFEDLSISNSTTADANYGGQEDLASAVEDLLARCRSLLAELDVFTDELAKRKQNVLQFRHFRTSVVKEIKFFEKVGWTCILQSPAKLIILFHFQNHLLITSRFDYRQLSIESSFIRHLSFIEF